jgi:hypothetical protein
MSSLQAEQFRERYLRPLDAEEPVADLDEEALADFIRERNELGFQRYGPAFGAVHDTDLSVRRLVRILNAAPIGVLAMMNVMAGPYILRDEQSGNYMQRRGMMFYRQVAEAES